MKDTEEHDEPVSSTPTEVIISPQSSAEHFLGFSLTLFQEREKREREREREEVLHTLFFVITDWCEHTLSSIIMRY